MSQSKTEIAYNYIKGKIVEGELIPRTSISEEDFQEALQMSRTPIREAILQLQNEFFLEMYPRKGIRVAPITFELLNEVFDLRRTVEPHIFEKACGKLPTSWLLKQKNRFLDPTVPKEDIVRYAHYLEDVDSDFCGAVLQASDNRFFVESMQLAYDHVHRICALAKRETAVVENDLKEHIAIIDAMCNNDPKLVFSLVSKHVENTRKNVFMYFLDNNV